MPLFSRNPRRTRRALMLAAAGCAVLAAIALAGTAFATDTAPSPDTTATVTIATQPMTLAGAEGRVPITLANHTELPLHVTVRAFPSRYVRTDRAVQELDLEPGDNLVQVPVKLLNTSSGSIRVEVRSNGLLLAQQVVPLRATLVDRLVLVGIVFLLMSGGLILIARRVRSARGEGL